MALVGHRTLASFTGRTPRLLVTARLVILMLVGSPLLCASYRAWAAVASAVLLRLTADRLLGRRALADLQTFVRQRP